MPAPFDYVITHSGREVSPTRGVPSIDDLALALSRQPRFGGMCRRHWTVLDHSLFTARLAERDGQRPEVQIACLLHDAHEWTGDIPTHFKTPEQKALQWAMDQNIRSAYARETQDRDWQEVKQYDMRALLAEAMVVGPPLFQTSGDVLAHFGARPRLRDVIALSKGLNEGTLGADPSELDFKMHAVNAVRFTAKLAQLQQAIKQPVTAARHSEPQGFIGNETRGNNG